MQQFSIALAQVNFKVGDIDGNLELISAAVADAKVQSSNSTKALMVVFSELALTGYPPEDLLLRPSLQRLIALVLQEIPKFSTDVPIVVGYPWQHAGQLFNLAGVGSN